MAIELKTYNEILGQLIRKMIADSPVNDLNRGSVLLTLLEAIATSDFDNNAAILSVLETLNIDALKNIDLDSRAADYGLSRNVATKATGFITISDSSITKRSTTLYAIKPAPIAGNSVLYVNDASTWSQTGSLFIGRGTTRFEGPINYTSIVNNGSFYSINLASTLQNDHLLSDTVIDAQGKTDRLISSGTSILIPANNRSPEISFVTVRNAVLAAGESSITNVPIISNTSGSSGNAGIGTITTFSTPPFANAVVTNTTSLVDGKDTESDEAFKERIKAYSSTLARGTREAILAAVIGISDSDDGKQVASAVVTEPPNIGDPSILYIDDGTGFQPSYIGQPVDTLLSSAIGDETFLQLANYPLPRPQVVNQTDGPISILDGSVFRVTIDSVEDSVVFQASQFNNITAASLIEIAAVINDNATYFRCRLSNQSSRLLIYPINNTTENIQVQPIQDGEDISLYANNYLKFPTTEVSYISLYRNGELLSEKQKSASLSTIQQSNWNITIAGNLIIQVDGTPAQDRTFATTDFSVPIASLTLSNWAEAFNNKFAGITATATSDNKINIVSNRIGSSSSLVIIGGTYFTNMFAGVVIESYGNESQFSLNRQTGNLELKISLSAGDIISAGTEDAKGFVKSFSTDIGSYNLATDTQGHNAELVVCADGLDVSTRSSVAVVGSIIDVSIPSLNKMRILSNIASTFLSAQVEDYIYIAKRSAPWLNINNIGLFKIVGKGSHISVGIDTFIDVININAVVDSASVVDSADIQIFKSDTYPQIWKGSSLSVPAVATLQDINNSINSNIINAKSSIFKTNSIKLTSTTEDNGAIAIPVSMGSMTSLFQTNIDSQLGNQSHIANKKTSKDLVGWIRSYPPSDTFLDRTVYSDISGKLTTAVRPLNTIYGESLNSPITSYSLINDLVYSYSGANKSQIKPIIDNTSTIQTEVNLPVSIFDYNINDDIGLTYPLTISADDSIVFIFDGDSTNKLINVNLWRTGRVNTQYIPSTTSFSADDSDNESGINFSTLQVWSKTQFGTEFKDYAAWFRSRNWYRTGGISSSGGTMLIRSKEYGPNGDNLKFSIVYPTNVNQSALISHVNTPIDSLTTVTLASDINKTTGIIGGTTFKVTNISTNIWRYTFQQPYVDLSSILVGDIISVIDSIGVSSNNRGQFGILNVNVAGNYLDVYNINGTATSIGLKEITQVNTIADVSGTPSIFRVDTSAEGAGSSQIGPAEYFTLYDDVGMVVFWFDINNAGTIQPIVSGASRYVEISTVLTGDSAAVVATKTALVVDSDTKFSASQIVISDTFFTVTNEFNGPVTTGSAEPNSGFIVTLMSTGTIGNSLGGKYFSICDASGSVAVWFNVNSDTEPAHGLSRSIQVLLNPGETANNVATKIATALNTDSAFTIPAPGANILSISDAVIGARIDALAMTSGFTVSISQQGTNDGIETILSTSNLKIFSLIKNTVQEICDLINTSQLLIAAPIGDPSKTIITSTADETNSISYSHVAPQNYIQLYDGENFIKSFSNSNPNFIFKKAFLLNNVVPFYSMSSCPNSDSTSLGESFKLIPRTIYNVMHHLKHKALSQLQILSSVDIAGHFKNIQIKSNLLGTQGSVEVVGGRGNNASFSVIEDIIPVQYLSNHYLEAQISAYPLTINKNDAVRIYNSKSAKRLNYFDQYDTVDIQLLPNYEARYFINFRDISGTSSSSTTWTISDVSSLYGAIANTVWQWENDGTVDLSRVVEGDILQAWDLSWASGNQLQTTGTGEISGFPIVHVDSANDRIHVINPFGVSMSATAVGINGKIKITPSISIRWQLKHNTNTFYKVEKLGFLNLFKITAVSGDLPYFVSCGVAVDDILVIKGNTFNALNRGSYRVCTVSENSLIIKGLNLIEELNSYTSLGSINWISNSTTVTSPIAFPLGLVGKWIKKVEDSVEKLVQVSAYASTTQLTLAQSYSGITGTSEGVYIDQISDISTGIKLLDIDDLCIFNGDSTIINDNLIVENYVATSWFSTTNSGTYSILQIGTDDTTKRQYISIYNPSALVQSNVNLGANLSGFYILEGSDNLFETIRFVTHTSIDSINNSYRDVFMVPSNKSYKMSQSYGTTIESLGKINFDIGLVSGIDGYSYYVGLLRTVQRIVDGYEPDSTSFPGQRAIGSTIEVLPPLTKTFELAINVTTKEGVSLTDITNDIKSTIIRYVTSLGVGDDVIISEIVSRMMSINGVEAVTFTNPTPSTERIAIADDQKAIITPDLISIS